MEVGPTRALEVFYSYAHRDEKWRDELEKQLSSLKRQGLITGWHDRKISPGMEWASEIDIHLNTASIILLLVSPDFIASDYCYGIEMKRAMERHEAGEARVIPIILRPTDWKGTPFDKINALPTDGKPVTRCRNRDQAFLDIANGIRRAIEYFYLDQKQDVPVNTLRQEYLNELYERWKSLDFRGIMHAEMNRPMGIPLNEVFVCPDLLSGVPEFETLDREDLYNNYGNSTENNESGWVGEQEEIVGNSYQLDERKMAVSQREDLHAVLTKYRRIVILGDPGSGKSTILRYVLMLLVKGEKELSSLSQLAYLSSYVPLHMTLASYAEFWRSSISGERSLKQFLPRYLNDNYLDSYSHFLQRQLEQGSVYLLFDGLDEIPDSALRIQIVRQIEAFTYAYPRNRVLVTSRIVGYNEKQIKSFTKKWCPAYEHWVRGTVDSLYLRESATKEAEKLFVATQHNPGVKRLAVNPLLLTILALIQRQGIELPSHRIELFELCATTLIDTWARARGQSMQFSKTEIVKILRPLAFWMHEYPEVGAIPEKDLIKQIVKNLRERQITEGEANRRAEQFLHTVCDELGILVERGKQRYGFLHQTFEEYFAASELEQNENRDIFIRKHLHDQRWREVILLTVGIIGIVHSNEVVVTKLIREAILKANSPFEKWLHRDLLFAGLCLADDVGVSVDCEDDIIERIINLYIFDPFDWLRNALSSVLNSRNGMQLARKASSLVFMILVILQKQEMALSSASQITSNVIPTFSLLSFDEELIEYYQSLIQQYEKQQIKLIRLRCIFILSYLQTNIEEWIHYALTMLSDSDYIASQAIIKVFGQVSNEQPQVIYVLLQLLSSPDYNVRWAAIKALGQAREIRPDVIDALFQIFLSPDSDYKLKQTVVESLRQGDIENLQITDKLLQLLSGSDYYLKRAAIEALGLLSIGEPHLIDALLRILSSQVKNFDQNKVKRAAVKALGLLGDRQPRVIEALYQSLLNRDNTLKREAAVALGRLGDGQPRIIDALLQLLSSGRVEVKSAAAEALGQLGTEDKHIIDILLPLAKSSNSILKIKVAKSIGQLGAGLPQAINSLYQLGYDSNADVRIAAAKAFGQVGNNSSEVISFLLHLLTDADWRVRQASARTITTLKINHKAISLQIETLLRSESIESNQLEADDKTDALLFALFQVVGEV